MRKVFLEWGQDVMLVEKNIFSIETGFVSIDIVMLMILRGFILQLDKIYDPAFLWR